MKPSPRAPSRLSDSLTHRLNMYALAASAASSDQSSIGYGAALAAVGLGMLALPQAAQARIIYMPTNSKIQCKASHSLIPLDLNHDGIADFSFVCSTASGDGGYAGIVPISAANKVWQTPPNSHGRSYVAARHAGALIKANRQFRHNSCTMTRACRMIEWNRVESHTYSYGPWANVVDRYLAFRFTIKGSIHFGWARIRTKPGIQALYLTGYAYETVPNKPIIAGKTRGRDEATLGHLATGASPIPAWRVKPTAATTH